MVVITVRLIRNFEYRAIKTITVKDINTSTKVSDFILYLKEIIPTTKGVAPPFKSVAYDTLKISHQAGGFKANDIVINVDDDEGLILAEDATLGECNVGSETEVSFFIKADYLKYKANPGTKW